MHTMQIMWGSQNLYNFFNNHHSTLAFSLCSLGLILSSQIPPSPTKGEDPPPYHLFHIILPFLINEGLIFLWFFTPRSKLFFPIDNLAALKFFE